MYDLETIRQALRSTAFDEALAEHLGLNATDLRCLELAMTEPGITPGRMAQLTGLTSGAITGVLDRLSTAGYVERRPDAGDRRSVTVVPVAARVTAVSSALAPLHAAIERLLGPYSPRERSAIAGFVAAAGRAVDEETARLRARSRGGFVGDSFSAPLGDATRGRLVFASGAPRLSMNLSPLGPSAAARIIMEPSASRLAFAGATGPGELVAASFDGPLPDVRAADGVVSIRYRRQPRAAFSSRSARIALSDAIPWAIELGGGITDLTGSLAGIPLQRIDVDGGANHVSLDLPRPRGTVVVRVRGVISSARLRRPEGVPVAVSVAGGVSHLRIDGKAHEQVGGERRFVSAGFAESPDRYEIEVLGGASDFAVAGS